MSVETLDLLDSSRKELLDLGLRNSLLNHSKKVKQIAITNELSSEVFRLLVTENCRMSFDPYIQKNIAVTGENNIKDEYSDVLADEWSDLGEDLSQDELSTRYVDNKLQTRLDSNRLQTRLLSIHNDARTYIEEQGINILYLALGFLEWYEAPIAEEPRHAPLILVPVELVRGNALERFQLVYTGDDIGDNLSLVEKLKTEFNIDLPRLVEASEMYDIEKYYTSISDIIQTHKRWKIEPNEITLGFFSFGKFMMYKDLEPSVWSDDAKCPGFKIIDALLNSGFREPASTYDENTKIDLVTTPNDIYQVRDADSSQLLAILDVNSGRNLVLQGPPGTGKSQTITNVIAECIGKGLKVLFVSEKMAALEVVKRRLDDVGLGVAVLELHSHKSNKKQVIYELAKTLNLGRPLLNMAADDDSALLTTRRNELNDYCGAVNKSIGNTRTNFIMALGKALRNDPGDLIRLRFSFGPMSNWSEADYHEARFCVQTLGQWIHEKGVPSKHAFAGSALVDFVPSRLPELEHFLETSLQDAEMLIDKIKDLTLTFDMDPQKTLLDVRTICQDAHIVISAPDLGGIILNAIEWRSRINDIKHLVSLGKAINEAHVSLDMWFIDDIWLIDILDIRRQYASTGTKWWRFLSRGYKNAQSKLQGLARKELPIKAPCVLELLDRLMTAQKQTKKLDELNELGASVFGSEWKGMQSDWCRLEIISNWVNGFFNSHLENPAIEKLIAFLSRSPKTTDLQCNVYIVESCLKHHEDNMIQIADMLKLRLSPEAKSHWNIDLKNQSTYLSYWLKNAVLLNDIVRYNRIVQDLEDRNLRAIAKTSRDWTYEGGALLRLFDYSWYMGLVDTAYQNSPIIKTFNRIQQDKRINDFTRVDHRLFEHNRARLARQHWDNLPDISAGGEVQIITREAQKKRCHMTIRKLITEAGRAVQAIKPIFMMSPMSVATFIPPGSIQFDLVVFDEASQVRPADAFGAILRGRQIVVVGDSKQLPPTNFFNHLIQNDEDDDGQNIAVMESILGLFLAKGAPERMLRWHYRSRHESLIAVSNNEFYENKLMVFPSPGKNQNARGLHHHLLSESVYDRGHSRTNIIEAKTVAKSVMEHARTNPQQTLGVVAFSVAQRDAIELQLELLRREFPAYESFFASDVSEPFFVKNLESVQGDERDVIYISIGYGKDSNGRLTQNFGPLNGEGGERRLNVLISRARLSMDVYSNFTAHDIDVTKTQSLGVKALKTFLEYAKTGKLEQPRDTGREPDSPFEEHVIRVLRQHGIAVESQVGSA